MSDLIQPIRFDQTTPYQDSITEQQENSKKASGIWSLFPDSMIPWKKEPSFDLGINSVQSNKTEAAYSSKTDDDEEIFYKSLSEFLEEAKQVSKETGLPLRDVFEQLDRLQLQDQQDLLKESQEMAKKELLKNVREHRKIEKERIQKMMDTLERAQKTRYWDRFLHTTTLLQLVLTTAKMGALSSNPFGLVVAGISLGEAIDSMFDDTGKKFLLNYVSKVFPEDQQKNVEDRGVQAFRLGAGLSSLFLTFYSSEGLSTWWSQLNNSPLRNPSVRGITISELSPVAWVRSLNITEFGTNIWQKKGEILDAIKNRFWEQTKYLTFTTDIATRGIKYYHEKEGNKEKASLLMLEQSRKQADEKFKRSLKTLKGLDTQELRTWENQRNVHEARKQILRMLARFN